MVDEVIGTMDDHESQIYFEVCICKNSQKPCYGKTQGMGKTHRLRRKVRKICIMSKTLIKLDEGSELNGVWSSRDGCLIKTYLGSKNPVGKMLLIVRKKSTLRSREYTSGYFP